MRTDRRAFAAIAKHRTVAFTRPGGKRLAVFRRVNANRYPTVFGVLTAVLGKDCQPVWYRVQLPMKPNGIEGYVRASAVELARLHSRIVIDLSERRLELLRRGESVLRVSVAIGAPITPTPRGTYYINQRLVAPDPWGPFGPGALGISAFSPVLQEWTQGGPIAIHGTNEPSSIGHAVSHGCVRVQNETLLLLFRMAPAGTPVFIKA
jgi:lipoprotein-anchoring transpeptidase ErfK/SrfK